MTAPKTNRSRLRQAAMRRTWLAVAAYSILACCVGSAEAADPANKTGAAQPVRVLRLQSGLAPSSLALHILIQRIAPRLEVLTDGALKAEILPIHGAVPGSQTLEAVAAGILDGDLNFVAAYAGKNPAYALLGDLALLEKGARPDVAQAFCDFGGGAEMLQTLHDRMTTGAVQVIGCGAYAREYLYSKKAIGDAQDFKGLSISARPYLTASALRKLGAKVSTPDPLAQSVLTDDVDAVAADALEVQANGTIAAESSQRDATALPVVELIVNRKVWMSLRLSHQAALHAWFATLIAELRGKATLETYYAQRQKNMSRDTMLQAALRDLAAETAAKSPLARDTYALLGRFMDVYGMRAALPGKSSN